VALTTSDAFNDQPSKETEMTDIDAMAKDVARLKRIVDGGDHVRTDPSLSSATGTQICLTEDEIRSIVSGVLSQQNMTLSYRVEELETKNASLTDLVTANETKIDSLMAALDVQQGDLGAQEYTDEGDGTDSAKIDPTPVQGSS
jgi:hypothetical protein